MNCNYVLHDELKNTGEPICPFCDRLLVEANKAVNQCCVEQNMATISGMNTCVNCGSVHGYDYATEYFNFYDNMNKIRQKISLSSKISY